MDSYDKLFNEVNEAIKRYGMPPYFVAWWNPKVGAGEGLTYPLDESDVQGIVKEVSAPYGTAQRSGPHLSGGIATAYRLESGRLIKVDWTKLPPSEEVYEDHGGVWKDGGLASKGRFFVAWTIHKTEQSVEPFKTAEEAFKMVPEIQKETGDATVYELAKGKLKEIAAQKIPVPNPRKAWEKEMTMGQDPWGRPGTTGSEEESFGFRRKR
jgi:hypothetical protein